MGQVLLASPPEDARERRAQTMALQPVSPKTTTGAATQVSSRPQWQSATDMQRRCLPALQSVAERLGAMLKQAA